jgi:RNA polymerase sigma factor (TIGR02999 family)
LNEQTVQEIKPSIGLNDVSRKKVSSHRKIRFFFDFGILFRFDELKMDITESQQITKLLIDWSGGNKSALENLMPMVYDELHRIARRFMANQKEEHTFQTSDLIHEAYLKLVENDEKDWHNRAHFFGVAGQAMRHILVDYARSKSRQKRGGDAYEITLDENAAVSGDNLSQILELNEVLDKLGALDERKVRVVEMKFFGGLTMDEIAKVLKISPETAKRDWSFARIWLMRELSKS